MSRVLTPEEKVLLRTRPQRTKLYLAVQKAPVVWTGTLVSASPATNDKVVSLTVTGAPVATDAPGMTLRVTSATGIVKGFARVHVPPFGGVIWIGETSQITFTAGDTLEILDEMLLWSKPFRADSDTTVYIDEETYSDQNTVCDPCVLMGSHMVLDQDTTYPCLTYWSAAGSWVVGDTIASYSWSVLPSAGVVINNGNTATPRITFPSGNTQYRVTCTVTSTGGAEGVGHRYVLALGASNPEINQFTLNSCQGSYDSGGWEFGVTLYDQALTTEIGDRVLCFLCAKDWYGSTDQDISFYESTYAAGRSNIVAMGWINGETINWNPDRGTVAFDVQGPAAWLNKLYATSDALFDADMPTLPTGTSPWFMFDPLTVDKAIWHMCHWRSTIDLICDVNVTGDTREIGILGGSEGTVWSQLQEYAYKTILATPCFDRFGRLFVQIDQNLIAPGTRVGAYPIVQEMIEVDWRDNVLIERTIAAETAQVDLSGVAYSAGTAAAYFALAYGHTPAHWGSIERMENLALIDQATTNAIASLLMGKRVNQFQNVTIPMSSNQRVSDITPRQWVTMIMEASDTERGLTWPDAMDTFYSRTTKYLIPRTISYEHTDGMLLTTLECEGEAYPTSAVVGDTPPVVPPPPDPGPPPEPEPEPEPVLTDIVLVWNADNILRCRNFFKWDETAVWDQIRIGDLLDEGVGDIDCVAASNGQAWAATHNVAGAGETYKTVNGIYYCADLSVDTPVWTMIYNVEQAKNALEAFNPGCGAALVDIVYYGLGAVDDTCYGAGYFNYLGFCGPEYNATNPYRVPVLVFTSTFQTVKPLGMNPDGYGQTISHAPVWVNVNDGEVFMALQGSAYLGADADCIANTNYQTSLYTGGAPGEPDNGAFVTNFGTQNYVMQPPGLIQRKNFPYAHTIGDVPQFSTDGANAGLAYALREIAGHVFYIRSTGHDLMDGSDVMALSLIVFGFTNDGGIFTDVNANGGELIWLNERIGITTKLVMHRSTGGDFTDRSGNVAGITDGGWKAGLTPIYAGSI